MRFKHKSCRFGDTGGFALAFFGFPALLRFCLLFGFQTRLSLGFRLAGGLAFGHARFARSGDFPALRLAFDHDRIVLGGARLEFFQQGFFGRSGGFLSVLKAGAIECWHVYPVLLMVGV